MVKGIAVSDGIVIGKVFKLEQPIINIVPHQCDAEEEKAKLAKAQAKTLQDIEKIKQRASKNLSDEELAIFDGHLMMASDPEFNEQIITMIEQGSCAECATRAVADTMIEMFENMDNEYFKERAADIKDVSYRLICNILDVVIPDLTLIDEEVILVAKDLAPSDTAQLNKKYTLGFVTEIGGRTSHSAIMARSLEIPAIVGVSGIMGEVNNGATIIMDAIKGEVITEPNPEEIAHYTKLKHDYESEKEALKVLVHEKSITLDGHEVELASNIGTPKDVEGLLRNGAEGSGLYRTEFLYLDSTDGFPSEDAQFEAYKTVLEQMDGRKVVVRTLDIGGDKKLSYFEFPPEMNPFLGYRAIRMCLDRKDIFRTQIRALLRSSVYGKLCIMFPMIATIEEFLEAKALVMEEKANLKSEGQAVSEDIEIGMMIEIPSAAIMAREYAKYADFFSIGTNDLIQYTMAADRMSKKVSYLYQPLHPALLRLIKMTIDGAHAEGRWVGMCGEMAGDPDVIPVLLGLGLDEFSMSSNAILRARKTVRSLKQSEMEVLASQALTLDSEEKVIELVKKTLK